jgi:hypothetical protein
MLNGLCPCINRWAGAQRLFLKSHPGGYEKRQRKKRSASAPNAMAAVRIAFFECRGGEF